MDIIGKITSDNYFKELTNHKNTRSIYLIGSLLRDDYIEGWSDVDLITITNDTSVDYLKLINRYCLSLSESTQTKVGTEVIDYTLLRKISSLDVCPGEAVKYAKNLNKNGLLWTKGVLYPEDENGAVKFNLTSITKESLLAYANTTVSYMNKLMLGNSELRDKKYILRKIVKNSLLLIQTFLLVETNELITDFPRARAKFSNLYELEISPLENSFDKRFIWGTLLDKDIDESEIVSNWKVFNLISNFIIKRC